MIQWAIKWLMRLGRYRHVHQQTWINRHGIAGGTFVFKKYEEDR